MQKQSERKKEESWKKTCKGENSSLSRLKTIKISQKLSFFKSLIVIWMTGWFWRTRTLKTLKMTLIKLKDLLKVPKNNNLQSALKSNPNWFLANLQVLKINPKRPLIKLKIISLRHRHKPNLNLIRNPKLNNKITVSLNNYLCLLNQSLIQLKKKIQSKIIIEASKTSRKNHTTLVALI